MQINMTNSLVDQNDEYTGDMPFARVGLRLLQSALCRYGCDTTTPLRLQRAWLCKSKYQITSYIWYRIV